MIIFIKKELEVASNQLPIEQAEKGCTTKGAALALKSRTMHIIVKHLR